jgi:hypothetical protein
MNTRQPHKSNPRAKYAMLPVDRELHRRFREATARKDLKIIEGTRQAIKRWLQEEAA